jgi:hypothetical protein
MPGIKTSEFFGGILQMLVAQAKDSPEFSRVAPAIDELTKQAAPKAKPRIDPTGAIETDGEFVGDENDD